MFWKLYFVPPATGSGEMANASAVSSTDKPART